MMFSLIATALENRLNPHKYLTYIFKETSNIGMNNKEAFTRRLPWNAPNGIRSAAK